MKNFHDFYFGLTQAERKRFVEVAETTIGYAERVAGGYRMTGAKKSYLFMKAAKALGKSTSIEAIKETYEKRNGPLV